MAFATNQTHISTFPHSSKGDCQTLIQSLFYFQQMYERILTTFIPAGLKSLNIRR